MGLLEMLELGLRVGGDDGALPFLGRMVGVLISRIKQQPLLTDTVDVFEAWAFTCREHPDLCKEFATSMASLCVDAAVQFYQVNQAHLPNRS